MKWVTRSHIHVDRVACPWLIRRFVDSEAEFLFVPKSRVEAVANETGSIPFDAPGAELGHHEGQCSFESILRKYELKDPALWRLAKIVHAADIAREIDTDPLGKGLEAIATGFGILFPDDHTNLERQFVVYDALYAWCRLQGTREGIPLAT
ncbi:MAG: chromate resistance protein [Acidobacteria bacterium]|nr:chromate resistance protein [Acidobacteriota bacterium]